MARKARPSLKDYLRTGVVRMEEGSISQADSAATPEDNTSGLGTAETPPLSTALLSILSEEDRRTWRPILEAGTEIRHLELDFVSLREEFRTADRNRFTYYLLEGPGELLRPIRTSVQIREPVQFVLKWDEMGTLTLYGLL